MRRELTDDVFVLNLYTNLILNEGDRATVNVMSSFFSNQQARVQAQNNRERRKMRISENVSTLRCVV